MIALLLALLVVAPRSSPSLDRYAGRDLMRLPPADLGPLSDLCGAHGNTRTLWSVWRLDHPPSGHLIFEAFSSGLVPATDSARVTWVRPSSIKASRQWTFPTGHRLLATSATCTHDAHLSGYLVSVHTVPAINGRDMSDLILAFDGDLATVRIVDSNGGLLPNLYVQSGHAVGPTLPYSQLGDIRADLASNLPIHVLRALVFLSGEHRNPSLPRDAEPVRDPEWRTASLLHAFFETDPSVRRAVQRLAQSSQPWIRKQAQETLQRFRSTSVPRP